MTTKKNLFRLTGGLHHTKTSAAGRGGGEERRGEEGWIHFLLDGRLPTPEDPTHAARLWEGRPGLGKTIEMQGASGAVLLYEWMVRTGLLLGKDESQIDRSFLEGATLTHYLKYPNIRRLVDYAGHIPQGMGDIMEVAAEGVRREGRVPREVTDRFIEKGSRLGSFPLPDNPRIPHLEDHPLARAVLSRLGGADPRLLDGGEMGGLSDIALQLYKLEVHPVPATADRLIRSGRVTPLLRAGWAGMHNGDGLLWVRLIAEYERERGNPPRAWLPFIGKMREMGR